MSEQDNLCEDTQYQEAFWLKLQQFKYDLFYYNGHYNHCIKINRGIKYAATGLTTLLTLVWIECADVPCVVTICSIAIIILQVFNAISDIFPFDNRANELREMTRELDPLYIEMENTWRNIANGELSKSEIKEAIEKFDKRNFDIRKNYLKNDSLPEKEKINLKAEKQTGEYFEVFK